MTKKQENSDIRAAVRKHYGAAITQSSKGCCGSGAGTPAGGSYAHLAGYTPEELATMPESVTTFGCGNPTTFAEMQPGEVVLDLGSGAGMDLILASRKVGPTGKVIGLDMTPEMIKAANDNLRKAGIANFEIRQGEMEQMPVADGEVDWIISNCVINLSPDKAKVFAEAYRVLKLGGRMLVSDIVTHHLPEAVRKDIAAWVACVGGAVEEDEYIRLVKLAGFEQVEVVDRLIYDEVSIKSMFCDSTCCGPQPISLDTRPNSLTEPNIGSLVGKIASIKLSARKP
ncbi:arsenite S-adenosylmethyltransferase [candidate division GN15 bacterium]|uniref:Arsenite methyltransferase n=1 Tax=candidate division GN15 bacterium TaxID=2072418 RepID=A0A855X708_9BACT|nr:MAG: arsenite S-adenosylmethyltransferase [candidate division GN15 bacterium]